MPVVGSGISIGTGGWLVESSGDILAPGQGSFVFVSTTATTATFAVTPPTDVDYNHAALSLTKVGATSDRVITPFHVVGSIANCVITELDPYSRYIAVIVGFDGPDETTANRGRPSPAVLFSTVPAAPAVVTSPTSIVIDRVRTQWPSLRDLANLQRRERDYCDRHFPLITYWRQITGREVVDDVFDEVREAEKLFTDGVAGRPVPHQLRASAKPDPEAQPLSKFGVEETRDILMQASILSLVQAGLATQNLDTLEVVTLAKAGDRFKYSGDVYDVLTVMPSIRFANTDVPLYYDIKGTRYREPLEAYQEP